MSPELQVYLVPYVWDVRSGLSVDSVDFVYEFHEIHYLLLHRLSLPINRRMVNR